MTYSEMTIERLVREKIYVGRQIKNLLSQQKQIDEELEKRYDNEELGERE